MKVKIHAEQLLNGEMEVDLHDGYRAPNGIEEYEQTQNLFTDKMRNVSKMVMLDGILLGYGYIDSLEDFSMRNDSDTPHLEMQFQLKGSASYFGDALLDKTVCLDQGQHCLFFSNGGSAGLFIPQISSGHQFLGIRILPHVLLRYFGEGHLGPLGDLLWHVESKTSYVALFGDTVIKPAMQEAIHAIINCPYHGALKRLFLEAKVMELLTLQLSQLCAMENIGSQVNVGLRDKLFRVREIIESDYHQAHSLRRLASECGLNEFDLKKYFKLLFNQTVFGMITDVRLQHAKHLILDRELSVAEATYQVGYKTPQHFSAAFKKKYGYPPSLLKS